MRGTIFDGRGVPRMEYNRVDATVTEDPEALAERIAALAHVHRVEVFMLLARSPEKGLSAGEIAKRLQLAPSSLSFHLSQLERAGLLSARREQRKIFYAVNPSGTRELLGKLVHTCCADRPDLTELN